MKTIPWVSENVPSDEYSKLEQVVDPDSGFTIVHIPVGFHLWKGMKKTNLLTSDPLNYRAKKLAWFSTEPVATTYESEVYGDTRKYNFVTLKPLKLLVLLNNNNLKLILKKAIKEKYDKESISAFMATTGMGMTLEEQIEYFKNIREIGTNPIPNSKINIGPGAIIGTSKWDIHRVSVHTATDRLMAELICNITNLDGYIASNTPTFIVNPKYPLEYLQEEIMICKQATNVEITIGGIIPDFIGLQGYIIIDKNEGIVKKYYNNSNKDYKDILEREIVMAKHSNKLEGIVKTKFMIENEKYVFISKLYDSNLEDYLVKNIEKITEFELELIIKRCTYIINELNRKKILHFDTHLRNFLIIKNDKPNGLPYTIDLGDFGWSYILNYPYRHQTNTDYVNKIPIYIKINTDLKLFYWKLGKFSTYFHHINPIFNKYKIPELEQYYDPSETYFEFYFKFDKKFKRSSEWFALVKRFL